MFGMHWLVYALLMVVASALFHVFSKLAGQKIDPLTALVFVQLAGAGVAAAVFFAIGGFGKLSEASGAGIMLAALAGAVIALANFGVFAMYAAGAPMSLVVPLTRTGVAVLAVLFGLVLFRESLDVSKTAGILLGIFSIYLMVKK